MSRHFNLLTTTILRSIKKMDVLTAPPYFKQRLDFKRFFLAKLLGVDEAKIVIAETDTGLAFKALFTTLQNENFIVASGGSEYFEDYPPFCIVGLFYYIDKVSRGDFMMRAWGFAFPFEKRDRAFAKCLGEALERHAFYFSDTSSVHTYPRLQKKDMRYLFPFCATLQPEIHTVKTIDDLEDSLCMEVRTITGGPLQYLPANCLYWGTIPHDSKLLREPNTNGGGGGVTEVDALLSSLYEWIERDYYLLYWLSGKQPEQIDHKELQGDFGEYIKKVERDYNLEIYFLTLKYDIQAQVVITVIIDPVLHFVGIGGKASQNIEYSMRGSFMEALAILSLVRERNQPFPEEKMDFYLDETKRMKIGQGERMNMYCSKKGIEIIKKHFLSGKKITLSQYKENDRSFSGAKEELTFLQNEFSCLVKEKGEGYHVYYQNAVTRWTKKERYHVVKSYIPSFLCFYLDEVYRPVSSVRLDEFKRANNIPLENGKKIIPHFLG